VSEQHLAYREVTGCCPTPVPVALR